jgi:type VI protein secretion system component VasF
MGHPAREWAHAINSRRGEALETLAAEGVWVESVFLDSAADGDDLVHYMRAQSTEQAATLARDSVAAIDEFHRKFKRASASPAAHRHRHPPSYHPASHNNPLPPCSTT